MSNSRLISRSAGILYLIIIASGIFAQFFVRGSAIVPGDAALTATNIAAAPGFFSMSIAADLVMIISDIALAALFFALLRPVSPTLSLMTAFFRLVQAAILGYNLLNLFNALQFLRSAEYVAAFSEAQVQAQVLRCA